MSVPPHQPDDDPPPPYEYSQATASQSQSQAQQTPGRLSSSSTSSRSSSQPLLDRPGARTSRPYKPPAPMVSRPDRRAPTTNWEYTPDQIHSFKEMVGCCLSTICDCLPEPL